MGVGLQRFALVEGEVFCLGKIDIRIGQREGARLVDDEGRDGAQRLDGGRIFYQYVLLGGLAYAHHEGRGGGQAHGARTGDNQHRDGRQDALHPCPTAT